MSRKITKVNLGTFLKRAIMVSLFLLALTASAQTASAATRDLTGWAWSSNTGWLSFNCISGGNCTTSNYKVTVDDETGFMDGYAWSSNIGWISFRPADVTGCGSTGSTAAGARAHIDFIGGTGKASGWAKAIVAADSPFWNGCISLSDSKYHISPDITGNQGVTYDKSAKRIKGFAWGSNVIGWLRFLDVLCTTCQDPVIVTENQYNFFVQANSATLANTPGSTVSVPVNVTKLLVNDVGVSNITVSGLPENVTASWVRNGVPVTGNPTCASTAAGSPTAAGACSFSLVLTAGPGEPIANTEHDLTITATSNTSPVFSRSDSAKLNITDITCPTCSTNRDYSVSLSDVTMTNNAGSVGSTPVIITKTFPTDIGIANVVIDSGLASGLNIAPKWYRAGTQVDPRSCASTAVGACVFTLQFVAEPGNATVGTYNLRIITTSTGSPVISKTTNLTLTVTQGPTPGSYGLAVDASPMTLNKNSDTSTDTPVTVTRTTTTNPELSDLTVSGVPQGLTISWTKAGIPVTGARTCVSLDAGACQFRLRLGYAGGQLPAKGVYPITFTAKSRITPTVTATKTVTLEVTDNNTAPGVVITLNGSNEDASVPRNSRRNFVKWQKTGEGSFDSYIITNTTQSGNINPQWSRVFDGSHTEFTAHDVTISEGTTFIVQGLNASGDVVSEDSVKASVYNAPDFREF